MVFTYHHVYIKKHGGYRKDQTYMTTSISFKLSSFNKVEKISKLLILNVPGELLDNGSCLAAFRNNKYSKNNL